MCKFENFKVMKLSIINFQFCSQALNNLLVYNFIPFHVLIVLIHQFYELKFHQYP